MADLRAIHEFSTASEVKATTLFLVDSVDQQASSGYSTEKVATDSVGEAIVKMNFANAGFNTTSKNVVGAINEVLAGGGGASTLDDLTDVVITSPSNGQVLKFDSANNKWINGTGGSGGSMVINITRGGTSAQPTYTIDKTYPEIVAAIEAGYNVVCKEVYDYGLGDETRVMPLFLYDTTKWAHLSFFYTLKWGSAGNAKSIGALCFTIEYDEEEEETYCDYNFIEGDPLYWDLTATLQAGQTSITINSGLITDTNYTNLDFYTSIYGVSPTSVSIVSGTSITLTFEAQSTNMNVKVRIW